MIPPLIAQLLRRRLRKSSENHLMIVWGGRLRRPIVLIRRYGVQGELVSE